MLSLAELKKMVGSDPHDLADAIQAPEVPPDERVRLLLDAFEDSPSYGILMYLKHEFDSADHHLRAHILERFLSYSKATTRASSVRSAKTVAACAEPKYLGRGVRGG